MKILGSDDFDQDTMRHYNHVVDSLNQSTDAGKSKSRLRVGRVGDKEFIEPEKSRKKIIRKKPQLLLDLCNYKQWSKISWTLCILLFVGCCRLVLMNQGVLNYFEKKQILSERLALIEQLKDENNLLMKEIKRANEDVKYQKNLAREQLGVISSEEYLLLFAPKKSIPSN